MTIAEMLTSIANSKTSIKAAIVNKGVAVADSDAFSTYAGKIGSISGSVEKTTLASYTDGELVDIKAADLKGCKKIRYSGFANNSSLKSVEIPEGCTAIDTYGFLSCPSLTSVYIPSTVKQMGMGIFTSCSKLATVTINKASGTLGGSPWGAPSTCTISWIGTE